tara:strand:- start:310 stop:561 length:252 start_codon:yes stop_codon:yes gene_type:complete
MAYYTATNTGKGFITHADNESAHVAGYPGDVWVTENSTWATRVGATSKTKAEAQLLVDNAVSGTYHTMGPLSGSAVSGTIVLP